MFTIQILTNAQVLSSKLDEEIIAFDKENMREILERQGMPFPEEKRRKGFETEGNTIIAFDCESAIAGYIQYGPDWNDPEDIFIGSLQIASQHRKTRVFRYLIDAAVKDLKTKSFKHITASVQKSNTAAYRIYQKLGFSTLDNSASETSYRLVVEPSGLEDWRKVVIRRK